MAEEQQTEAPQADEQAPEKASPGKSKSGGKRIIYLVLLLGIVVLIGAAFLLEYVEPNQYGIKIVKIGVKRGVQEKIYPPGYHLVLPFGFEEMDRLPKDVQVLELTNSPQTAATKTHQPAAHIQTSDGFYVDVDVSILYRIVDPFLVFTTLGPDRAFETNGLIPRAEPLLKATLGDLTTEGFYNSPLRVQKAEAAKMLMNKELNPRGIQVDHVLVRYFYYSDEIQKNIEEKKLKDQLVFKNQAEARAATEEASLKKIEQEGKAAVLVELEKGRAYTTRRNAERDLYARKKKAEANLLIQVAEAGKVRLRNEALRGVGAERMVGLKMADVYKGMEVVILPSDGTDGINPLDLDHALKLFDVRQGGSR